VALTATRSDVKNPLRWASTVTSSRSTSHTRELSSAHSVFAARAPETPSRCLEQRPDI
jgi:hypothetical protein